MGVLGLYTFVQSKLGQRKTWTSATKDKTASGPLSSSLSIPLGVRYLFLDGNAYIHHLYCGQFEWTYGGQYSAFVNYLIANIRAIQAVGFTLVFLFDGPLPLQKLQTRLARDTEKISRVGRVMSDIEHKSLGPPTTSSSPNPYTSNGTSSVRTANFLIPPLVMDITLQTLRDLGVDLCVCDGEADGLVAQLTKEKSLEDGVIEAYALSKDSDYFIFNTGPALKGGYIPLDTFIVSKDETTGSISISATVYTQEAVADHLGILVECLPLFASLTGNDYIRPETFEKQISRALETGTGQKLLKASNIHQTRIRATAGFLKTFGAGKDTHRDDVRMKMKKEHLRGDPLVHHILEEVMDERRDLYPKETEEDRNELLKAVLNSMEQYSSSGQPIDVSSSSLSTLNGGGGSVQMREAFRTGQFSFKLMDVVCNGMFWCTPFLEDTDRESAWLVSRELRRWVYGILSFDLAGLPSAITAMDGEGIEDGSMEQDGDGTVPPTPHDPRRMKEVVEYVRRGDHLSSEIVPVATRGELERLSCKFGGTQAMDLDVSSTEKSLSPPSSMSLADRTTLFLRVLSADTPRVRKLSRQCMVLAATLRYLITSLAHSKTRSANSPMANYEVIAFIASAMLALEKYPPHQSTSAANGLSGSLSLLESALKVKSLLVTQNDELPPVTKRSLHLSTQFQHTLGSVSLLANALHLDEILPPLSTLFDGLLFQQVLALARGGSSVEQKMASPHTIEAYIDTLLAVEDGFVEIGDIDVVVVFRKPQQLQQQHHNWMKKAQQVLMYGKQVEKPSNPVTPSSTGNGGGAAFKTSKKSGGIKKNGTGSNSAKKRAQAGQGSRRSSPGNNGSQGQSQGGGGSNMFNVLALGCEF